jgi:integrase
MLFILCAASGLGLREALGIEIPHVSSDGSCIHICQKAWRGKMHDFLKTRNGEREIDLHPSVANLPREFIGERKSGLLFRTRTGQQLHQSNILWRVLHPILEKLGQPKCGVHAFRRFRNTLCIPQIPSAANAIEISDMRKGTGAWVKKATGK